MPDSPITIFISYAHIDSPFVDRLEADLRRRGFNTWMDRRGLAGGQKWRRELQDAIDRSQILLVVLSPNAVESQYIQAEYGYAIDEGKVVIPLYYRPCKVPMELRGIQWIDFQHIYEQGLDSLLQALSARGITSSPPAASEENYLSQEGNLPAPHDSEPPLALPSGTVTFLFTDIEDSTSSWEQHPEAMRKVVVRYDALLRSVISAYGGFIFKIVGEAVCTAFAIPGEAVAAAAAAQQAIAAEQWGELGPLQVRMALDTGIAQIRDADYFGPTLNRVARLLSTASGGQVLLSAVTQELIRDSLPEGVKLKDLGEHALKDLLRPEHVYQLVLPELINEFPPLKSLSRRAQNLPMQPTSFVGREQEVHTVCELLHRPEVRLLTLTGPGGIGKTRLALHVAAELAEQFSDGAFLVPLAAISDSEQMAAAVLQTLGISDNSSEPPVDLLKRTLKDKQMLLLLDNFEQVVDAAVIVADLLAVCPGLKVLVTSRSVLHVRSEYEFVVLPLSMPDPRHLPDLGTLLQYEAIALFIQRAQAVKPDFALTTANASTVAAICTRLDGLPLAIELAAARSKFFAPHVLLSRLEQGLTVLSGGARDLPARQQTLHNTIQWSYDLLSNEEQQLFRWLSVFVGGCTLEAVDAVYKPDTDSTIDVLEGVMSLQDKSLLQQKGQESEEPRLVMLETIRQYGLERLRASGELEAAQRAHAQYYLALAEQATPYLTRTAGIRRRPRNRRNLPEETEHSLGDAEQRAWVERLEQEYENLCAALQWTAAHGDDEMKLTLRLSSGLLAFRIWAKETE